MTLNVKNGDERLKKFEIYINNQLTQYTDRREDNVIKLIVKNRVSKKFQY